ncbi:MAG: alpha/beta hydrolase [Bdellovibrionaceae bacterium]|nr:alpha/beta hydrolase [Pseudobdellovibrionaceae bacterium]
MRMTISLSQNRTLIAGLSKAEKRSRDWIVFLPESAADFQTGSRSELVRLIGRGLAAHFNFLTINKPGVGPRKVDREAFERSFRRHYRVKDALAAMKAVIPPGDRIYLVGYSEGAYLAPEIARLDRRVMALAMIGGGTRGWLKEELSNARPREKAAVQRKIREIQKHKTSTEKWMAFSYATWHSYREDRTLEALKKLRRPALAILGSRDRTIDLKSTLNDLKRLAERKPIQIEVLPRCGHSFNGHWAPVGRALREFLRTP